MSAKQERLPARLVRPNLRQRAEARAKPQPVDFEKLTPEEIRDQVDELSVQQAELEIQNEELRAAQLELAAARDRYLDLYEFAPVAYVSLDAERVIRAANLTSAGLFAVERQALLGKRLEEFLAPEDRDRCYQFLRGVIEGEQPQACEVRLDQAGGTTVFVRLDLRLGGEGWGATDEYRVVLTDVTRRRLAENEREQVVTELREALATVRTLHGLLPMCAACRRVRDDDGYWEALEAYISKHTDARFTHGLCPTCIREQYPDIADEILGPEER